MAHRFAAWIPKGRALDPASAAFDYFEGGALEQASRVVPAATRLPREAAPPDAPAYEHTTAIPGAGTVFSLLWLLRSGSVYSRAMSAISSSLTKHHIEAAIELIERDGVPPRRASTKFHVVFKGKRYPPKYVLSVATAEATGRELPAGEFYGGIETNRVLERLGFSVEGPVRSPVTPTVPAPQTRAGTEASTQIVRVVVKGKPSSSPQAGGDILSEAFERWPVSSIAKFTLTPGGFIAGRFPLKWGGQVAWASSPGDFDELVRIATPLVAKCVTKKVLAAAKARSQVLTIGIDLESSDRQPMHAELVAVIDCASGDIVRWTGKSYPTISQEAQLVQVADLSTHFLEIAGERVLILGCHDLNMFSRRGRANQNPEGVRRGRCDEIAEATARFRPTIVLQHPHSTDSANIWRMPWACLAREYPSVRTYASGIGYYAWEGKPRRSLPSVREGTRSGSGVVDVVVESR